jgi:DNA-3-methyladenine glycosylase II
LLGRDLTSNSGCTGPGRTLAEVSKAWQPYRTWADVHMPALREHRTSEITGEITGR